MNFRQFCLQEMPITNFQMVGNWQNPKSLGWSKPDQGILTNPNAVEKIHKKWSNTKENFDFYFVKQPGASQYLERGEVTPEWVKEKLGLDVQPNPSNITVIFTNNRGDEKIPMTAWIMAHRLGHTISRGNDWGYFRRELERDFIRILQEAYHYRFDGNYYGMDEKQARRKYLTNQNALLTLANAVGTMRSARMNNLRQWGEFAYELLAQRLLTGHIKFNPLPPQIVPDGRKAWGNPIGMRYSGDRDELREWDEVLQGYADHYESLLDSSLRAIRGKLYVM